MCRYSLFGSMDHITKFVAARLPESYDKIVSYLALVFPSHCCSPFYRHLYIQPFFRIFNRRYVLIMFSTIHFYVLQKQKKLTGLVHDMCYVISHAVGKLVIGVGKIDDDEWGTKEADPSTAETIRLQPNIRGKRVPARRDSLPSEEESFNSDSDDSEAADSESEGDGRDEGSDESDTDGSSDSDDGHDG